MSGPVPGTPTPWEAHQGVLPEQVKTWDVTAKTDGWRRSGECPQGYFVATVHETLNEETAGQDAAAIVHRMNNWDAEQAKIAALVAERNALRARVEVLEDDLLKASRPVWFYHPDHTEVCQWSPHEVVDDYYDPEPGEHVFEVECARPLPSIWCAVRVTDDEDADERFTLTEHASEDEALAALALAKGEAA